MSEVTNNCTTCEHAVHDELWGEYKCKLYQHRIYNPKAPCDDYKKEDRKEHK